jgi:DNA-directed RNA polymerase specialized sigma24 family protein
MSAPLPEVRPAPEDPPDPVDLGPIYRDARPRLIRLAVLLVDDLATAEDVVVQDVFVRLHRRGDAPIDLIEAYLTRAVLNTARSTLRRRRVAAGGLLASMTFHVRDPIHRGTGESSASRPAPHSSS